MKFVLGKTDEEQKEYNKSYYERNRAAISAKRKAKYANNPAYRARVQAKARNRYVKREKSANKRIGYTVKKADDGKVDLFSISYASQVTGRAESTLRAWERKGIIPLSSYTDSRGWRLYTSHQIEIMAYAFDQQERGLWNPDIMQKYLQEHWNGESVAA